MQRYAPHPSESREERRLERSARARSLSRWMKLALYATVMAAIWQERALAPPVHDRMQALATLAGDYIARSDTLAAYLPRSDRLSASADTGLAGALTNKLRQ